MSRACQLLYNTLLCCWKAQRCEWVKQLWSCILIFVNRQLFCIIGTAEFNTVRADMGLKKLLFPEKLRLLNDDYLNIDILFLPQRTFLCSTKHITKIIINHFNVHVMLITCVYAASDSFEQIHSLCQCSQKTTKGFNFTGQWLVLDDTSACILTMDFWKSKV